jgi:DNA-binding transcriptional LysR family regulator
MIRQLQYLVALAREEHFARAAASCGVSQATLSGAVRNLEDNLRTAIVERGNRFRGFTPEGEVVLRWARRILADERSLMQDIIASRGTLSGRLRLGAIPAANAIVSRLTTSFAREHPHVVVDWQEIRSGESLHDLTTFELDAAITYLDDGSLRDVQTMPISVERWVLALPEHALGAQRETITCAEAVALPLCLLRPETQKQRAAALEAVGGDSLVRVQVSSMMAMLCCLQSGYWSAILPQSLAPWLGSVRGIRIVPLVEPEIAETVGLVVTNRDPIPGLLRAFCDHVERVVRADASFCAETSVSASKSNQQHIDVLAEPSVELTGRPRIVHGAQLVPTEHREQEHREFPGC